MGPKEHQQQLEGMTLQELIAEQQRAEALAGFEGMSTQTRVSHEISGRYQNAVHANPEMQAQLDAMSPIERAQHCVDWQKEQGFEPTRAALRDLESLQYVEANPRPVQPEPVQPTQPEARAEQLAQSDPERDAYVLEFAQYEVEDCKRVLAESEADLAAIHAQYPNGGINEPDGGRLVAIRIEAAQKEIDSANFFLEKAEKRLQGVIEQQNPELAQPDPEPVEVSTGGFSIEERTHEDGSKTYLKDGQEISQAEYAQLEAQADAAFDDMLPGGADDPFAELEQATQNVKVTPAQPEQPVQQASAPVEPVSAIAVEPEPATPAEPEALAVNGTGNQVMPKTDDTMAIQQALVDAGYDIGHNADGTPMVDGLEGPLTRAAIEDYAQDQGLDLNEMTADELVAAIENTVQTQQIAQQMDMGGADVTIAGDPGFIQENAASIGVPTMPEPQPLAPGVAPQQPQMGTPGQMA